MLILNVKTIQMWFTNRGLIPKSKAIISNWALL